MKHKKTIISLGFLLLSLGGLKAQESPVATGGEAIGIGGIVSYSIGQVVYISNVGSNGSVFQGVQCPFEISTTVGINETTINLELSIYPNPTVNYLILKVEETDGLNYQLFDMQGRVIESKVVVTNTSNISLENQPSAIYFLKVTQNNQPIKTFKIIKN